MREYGNKRVVVTGGAGFLGSHLCRRLLADGCEVICVDNFYTGTRGNIQHLLNDPMFEVLRHDVTFPLYLEADDETLLRRFKETRRRHPMCEGGEPVVEGIREERDALEDIRRRADIVIDTSDLRPSALKRRILEEFLGDGPSTGLDISVTSFGFKYGVPIDADIVMDVRFLPNPYYDPAMRPLCGLDQLVRDYVMSLSETTEFLQRWFDLLALLVDGYRAEGKTHLAIDLGCTGGRHRSVALAEETARFLRERGFRTRVDHRDIEHDPGREADHR